MIANLTYPFLYLMPFVMSIHFLTEEKNVCIISNKSKALINEEVVVSSCGDQVPSFINVGLDWGDGSDVSKGQTGSHKYKQPGVYTINLVIDGKPVTDIISDAKNTQVKIEISKK